MRTNADLFLDIAERHLTLLEGASGPIFSGDEPSEHFRLALVCTTFSAFAVEHAMTELLWARAFLQTPRPYRGLTAEMARLARTIPAKLSLLRLTTQIDDDLLRDIKELLEDRNRIAHANIESGDHSLDTQSLDLLEADGRGAELDAAIERLMASGDTRSLDKLREEFGSSEAWLLLPGLSTEDINAARRHFAVAQKAVAALRDELNSEGWPAS